MFRRCTDFNSSSHQCKTALTTDRKIKAVEAAGSRTFSTLIHFYYDSNDRKDAPKVYLIPYQKALPSITQVPDLGSIKSYEPGYKRKKFVNRAQ